MLQNVTKMLQKCYKNVTKMLQIFSTNSKFRQFCPQFCTKVCLHKIFGGQNFSADKIFGTKPNFRQFCPPNFCPIRYMLHFKVLVTNCGHRSVKNLKASHFTEYWWFLLQKYGHTLYFQKILGFHIIWGQEIDFLCRRRAKNTLKWPFFHDKIRHHSWQ